MQLFTPTDDAQRKELAEVVGQAFANDPAVVPGWFQAAGYDNVRALREGHEVLGGCVLIEMGQYFGGHSVPMVGLAGVAVRADRLREGVASHMMRLILNEQREAGVALSTLYGSTQALYRKVGYAQAGTRYIARCKPSELRASKTRPLYVSKITKADWHVIDEVYETWARVHPGHLDRGPYIWDRLRGSTPERGTAYGLMVGSREAPQGYLFYRQTRSDNGFHTIKITDIVALTDAARQRLIGLIADLGAMAEAVHMHSAPGDPIWGHDLHPVWSLELHETFLVRVLDVKHACEARGYPRAITATVHLDLRDPDIPAQQGRWRIDVQDGNAVVQRGGEGHIAIDARGLGTVYTGHRSAEQAAQLGLCSADPEHLQSLSAVFAGPAPWMREMF